MRSSSFASSFSLASLSFVTFVGIAAIGCGAKTEDPTNAPTTESGITSQSSCSNKGCGVDCTPEGSDEPFNCASNGRCVAAGQPLGCK